jgi:hypothetical protein
LEAHKYFFGTGIARGESDMGMKDSAGIEGEGKPGTAGLGILADGAQILRNFFAETASIHRDVDFCAGQRTQID